MADYASFPDIEQWIKTSYKPIAWDEYLGILEGACRDADQDTLNAAIDYALRSAAIETGAVEGLYATTRGITRTIALQAAAWEAEVDQLGSDVRGHFDAQLKAFELVLDAATKSLPITEAWTRALHEVVCTGQPTYRVRTEVGWQDQELPVGKYKTATNSVETADGSIHNYAPVEDVPAEMARYIKNINSGVFASAHPVVQAAYAHYALVAIHPFADGNGRTARAVASVYFYRAARIPLIVFSDQQELYWDALAAADGGSYLEFNAFIEDRALDAMGMVTDRLREAAQPLENRAIRLRERLRAHGGLTHLQVSAIGQRILNELPERFSLVFRSLQLEPDITQSNGYHQGPIPKFTSPYHGVPGAVPQVINLYCSDPVQVHVRVTPFVGISNDVKDPFPIILDDFDRPGRRVLKLRISELHPFLTSSAGSRIDAWVKDALSVALDELDATIAEGLRQQGFDSP